MKVKKIGDNEIEVNKIKKVYDDIDKTKFVEVDGEPVVYGQKKIDYEREALQTQIDFLNDKEKRAVQIANLQAQLDDLDLIEQELNK